MVLSVCIFQLLEAAVAINDFLNTHHVFNRSEFNAAFAGSITDKNLLTRAIASGKIEKVRRGLYVSRADRFKDIKPSSYDIATKVTDDAVLCYLSALQLHGVLHNITSRTQFYTQRRIPDFEYDGQSYRPLAFGNRQIISESKLIPGRGIYKTTSKEQTIVDCLYRAPLAGGPENVLRSFSGFTYLLPDLALKAVLQTNKSTVARLGWVFDKKQDEWDIDASFLDKLHSAAGAGPHYFYSSTRSKDSHWVNKWKLYLPYPEHEMISWLNG